MVIALGLLGLYWILSETGVLSRLASREALRAWVDQLGNWGPLALILLMTLAIVMTPLPSGPIAVVAGAAYGPFWGTVYIVLGAELGALIAFTIARTLGYEALSQWGRVRPLLERLNRSRSQVWLMGIVFASRLIPFLSFNGVSYAAGLTPLAFWRFALATLAGVIPIAYLLAYFGEGLISAETDFMTIGLIVLSAITLLPIIVKLLWPRLYSRGG